MFKRTECIAKCARSLFGLSKDATETEVRKKYIELAKEHHPDRGGRDGSMKEINDTYQMLKREARIQKRSKKQGTVHGGRTSNTSAVFDEDDELKDAYHRADPERNKDILSWLEEERRRREDELLRQQQEEALREETDKANKAAFTAALIEWRAFRCAYESVEHSPNLQPAYEAWLSAWKAFNIAVELYAVWKADPYRRTGRWTEEDKHRKGLWDSDARQWRGKAWEAHPVWEDRRRKRLVS
eukprot:TRINITY_DN22391_c0_g1_i1.p1 TRINITY_DN22391_c0_g1~~TRINITY_DN22391_c0_g1_i1.p1  ORF type:complete len:260 (+),score=58.19 TRINITY_DN22391_c0_g1_i1:55-780(+)